MIYLISFAGENEKHQVLLLYMPDDFQLKPTEEPPKVAYKVKGRNYSLPEQTWRRSGSCPEGTIPIPRKPISVDGDVANRSLPFFSRMLILPT